MANHPTHVTRSSDASTFDEVCINCSAKDYTAGSCDALERPCPAVADVIANNEEPSSVDPYTQTR